MDTELIFYDKPWYECIKKLLSDRDSVVSNIYRCAGISAIHFHGDAASFPVPNSHNHTDSLFRLYLDDNYIALNTEIETCKDLVQRMYYSSLLGKDKKYIETLLSTNTETNPPDDYVSVLLSKMRARIATLSYSERQENKTLELQRALNSFPPERYKNAVSFLRMLFDSPARNMQKMEVILKRHEDRYAFNNRTTYLDHSYIGIWELKSYAYDYYFFFKENSIPLDYFLEPKEYLSYYLRAVLCSYSPENRATDIWKIVIHKQMRNYPIGEVDLDMFVKFTSPKSLKSWLEKYSVQHLVIEDGFEVTQKFINLCASFAHFRIQYWAEMIHNFTMLLCLIDLDDRNKCSIFKALAAVVKKAAESDPVMAEKIFDAIDLVINHMEINGKCVERALLLDALLADEIYPLLIDRKNGSFGRLLRKFSHTISFNVKKRIQEQISKIDNVTQKVELMCFFRPFYSKKFCISFFSEYLDYLSSEQCFRLLTEQIIPFDKKCWEKFVFTLEKEDAKRKVQPGMRTFPDWLMATIEECIILKLFGFDIDLISLEPYAHYSEHLSFMMNPEAFDYTKVNTENYMWQNLIYSKEYQSYFVEHKSEILSADLRKSFDLGAATEEQQKIVYGILLDKDELQRF